MSQLHRLITRSELVIKGQYKMLCSYTMNLELIGIINRHVYYWCLLNNTFRPIEISKGTAITLLVIGVIAFVVVVAVFTIKWMEWSPNRRYNRIDFLMNDIDD